MADYDFIAVWILNCMYQPYWVCQRAIWYTQLIYPLLWNEKSRIWPSLGCPRSHNRGHPCGRLCFFMSVWTPNCMYQTYWVRGSKGYVVHKAHIPPAVELKVVYMAKFGCLRYHKRGHPYGRLGFYGSLDPKLYVPAILGLWVYRLFGTAHIPPAVEWQIAFIAKFGVPSSPQSRASQLWNEKSRVLPSLGALVPTIEGASVADYALIAAWTLNCMYQPNWVRGSKGYLVHLALLPALMWNQNRVYGLAWDTLLRDWKPLWETSTCVGRLICPEGYVSSLNKCNPIQSLQFIQDWWIEKYS